MVKTTKPSEPPAHVVKVCPLCGHHTLVLKGQLLTCRSCGEAIWRSES